MLISVLLVCPLTWIFIRSWLRHLRNKQLRHLPAMCRSLVSLFQRCRRCSRKRLSLAGLISRRCHLGHHRAGRDRKGLQRHRVLWPLRLCLLGLLPRTSSMAGQRRQLLLLFPRRLSRLRASPGLHGLVRTLAEVLFTPKISSILASLLSLYPGDTFFI